MISRGQMYRQLYYAGGEGIASLDAGAPSIKYTGDIKPEMASSYIGGSGGPMSQMNDYAIQIYGKPLNELTGDELEELKNILRTPMSSMPDVGATRNDAAMELFGKPLKDLTPMELEQLDEALSSQASGGIMDVAPREQALFGGLKSAVKKVTGAVKDVVSSDLGKAALLAAAGSYGLGMGPLAGLKGAGFLTNIPGASFLGDKFSGIARSQVGKKLMEGLTSKTALVGLGGAALSLLADAGLSEEEIMKAQENPEVLKGYLRSSYSRVNPQQEGESDEAYATRVNTFVEENTREYRAEGGIISIDVDELPMSKEGYPKYYNPEGKEISFKEFQEAMKKMKTIMPKKKPSRKSKAKGGIMDVPVRQNKAGVKELDYRKKGGFVPPIGIKEKADDIPAMLSNNEFVFTADAVRGMGNGDVDKGAEKLYIMMKKLENGGRA